MTKYKTKKQRVSEQMKAAQKSGNIGLNKATSNLFRKQKESTARLDVRDFTNVINIDTAKGIIEVEGMTTYEKLVDATLKHGVIPPVVPQLKSITIGGAISGGGIEASSFKYGYVHETMLAADVLLSDGRVVTATSDNEHQDLFYGLPNSYGTLGYILKVTVKAVQIKPYVKLKHTRFTSPQEYFNAVQKIAQSNIDFLDGVVFAPDEMYLTTGTFVDEAPYASDYTFEHIFYKSISQRTEDYLTTKDFMWRWDTDWFWCSRFLGMENPLLRRLIGKQRLNSIFYTKLMRFNERYPIANVLDKIRGRSSESVIQDVEIPVDRAVEFLSFFQREIGISPVWVCPAKAYNPAARFPLFRTDPQKLYINFGFWEAVKSTESHPSGFLNKKIEREVTRLGGIKSLYSDVYYNPDEFWRIYNKPVYAKLKQTYDPAGAFKDLYHQVT